MKKINRLFWIALAIITLSSASMAGFIPPAGEGASPFSVARLVIAGSVENLEPVGTVNIYAASTEKVYCFLEATQIKADTSATFVWYHGETRMALIDLPLRQGKRWRTYSSKRLGGNTGDWRVDIQDMEGNVLQSVGFTVE